MTCCAGLYSEEVPNSGIPQVDDSTEFGAIARKINESANPYMGYAQIAPLEAEAGQRDRPLAERMDAADKLTWSYIRVGRIDDAIRIIDQVMAELVQIPELVEKIPDWHLRRDLAYLRKSEIDNCVVNHNKECGVFPLQGEGLHGIAKPAEEARKSLLAYLVSHPENPKPKWIINVLSMALGDFPHTVDPAYRVPPSSLISEYDIDRFPNIASALGIDTFDLAGGSVVDDFNNDGFLDIVTSSLDVNQRTMYLRNSGDGTFRDVTDRAGLAGQLGAINLIQGDYDNDGFLELYLLRGAWQMDDGLIRNSLMRNRGDDTFEDTTRQAGVAEPTYPSHSAVWWDCDNDGDLDLFVDNEDSSFRSAKLSFASNLFRNNGDSTFTDVARDVGLDAPYRAMGIGFGDLDNDGLTFRNMPSSHCAKLT